jgi:hypothetical protein
MQNWAQQNIATLQLKIERGQSRNGWKNTTQSHHNRRKKSASPSRKPKKTIIQSSICNIAWRDGR